MSKQRPNTVAANVVEPVKLPEIVAASREVSQGKVLDTLPIPAIINRQFL